MDIKRDASRKATQKSFAQIQQWMQSQLINPQFRNDYEDFVKSTSKLSAKQHLQIYQRSYIARLRDCMIAQFPALSHALGKELFLEFADLYLHQYPSKSYTLGDLGQHFGTFLEETRPDKDAEVKESWPDFMIELANFEFLVNIIFDEKADENHQKTTLETKEEDLKLVPVFHLYKHQFPVSLYYKEVVNDRNPTLPFEAESYCVLLRRKYRLGLFELNRVQYYFLTKLKETQSIYKTKQFFITQHNFDANELESHWKQWKVKWLEEGFFTSTSRLM
ncbi:DNA-binding domain-containing protein [uncultured Kordia sp.]|uniref:HvfC/BufC N-terminal domain-containing protein n=1 Tax=uncultured Kordia sp. TaxID=507699 RepID=UPI002627326F|nr:DNA-binding domain-containing protein [uncultured Kordia sp.]